MRLGFEVEIEDVTKSGRDIPGVTETTDNSLRNGKEYVSAILPDKDFASFLYSYLYHNIEGTYSERCGLHFHMDVTNKNKSKCMGFLKRYITVERTLFNVHSDILRSNNNFCNLLTDSTEELNIIRNYNVGGTDPHDYSKYMALNIKTMLSIGTFEFRALKAGISPEQFVEMLNIFEQLWDVKAPLPYADQINEKDKKEAESLIKLICTSVHSEPSSREFMDHHFREESEVVTEITESSIRDYLNNI